MLTFTSRFPLSIAHGLLERVRVVQVVPAVAVEGLIAGEVLGLFVPAPEPGKIVFVSLRFFAAVFVPFYFGCGAQDAGVLRAGVQGARGHEGANVQADAVIDVRVPADGLLVEWLPADEDVVGGFACEDALEFVLQVHRGGEAGVGAFCARLLLPALLRNPVAEVGVDEFLEGAAAFTIRRGELVIIHQRVKTVAQAVPDVPNEWTVMEQGAVLFEKFVAQPIVKGLAFAIGGGEEFIQACSGPVLAIGGGKEFCQALSGGRLLVDGAQAHDAVGVGEAV